MYELYKIALAEHFDVLQGAARSNFKITYTDIADKSGARVKTLLKAMTGRKVDIP